MSARRRLRRGSCSDGTETAGTRRRCRRFRMPLSFVVGRYFLYVLAGVFCFCVVPLAIFWMLLGYGFILPASYGAEHVDEVAAALADADAFDADDVPAAYAYTHLDVDGATVLTGDMDERALSLAREAVAATRELGTDGAPAASGEATDGEAAGGAATAGGAAAEAGAESAAQDAPPRAIVSSADGMYPSSYTAVLLSDGTWCVLSYNLLPQWAARSMRDTWPDPQTLFLAIAGVNLVLVVVLVALRASRVLTRKMAPLIEAAEAVGAQSLDFTVPTSNVAQVDDVLTSMDRMRADLKRALEEQWETEAAHRAQVTATVHSLKTPLTVVYGNAELLLEELDAGEGALSPEDRAELEALAQAVREADAALLQLLDATRGMSAPATGDPERPGSDSR